MRITTYFLKFYPRILDVGIEPNQNCKCVLPMDLDVGIELQMLFT